jgi:hypothetical protein
MIHEYLYSDDVESKLILGYLINQQDLVFEQPVKGKMAKEVRKFFREITEVTKRVF